MSLLFKVTCFTVGGRWVVQAALRICGGWLEARLYFLHAGSAASRVYSALKLQLHNPHCQTATQTLKLE